MPLQIKKALITLNGIMVEDIIYTCPLAVKEQWFLKVIDSGPIEADFYMDDNKVDEGFLCLGVGFEWCVRVVRKEIPVDVLAAYFKQIEEIKQLIKKKKDKL